MRPNCTSSLACYGLIWLAVTCAVSRPVQAKSLRHTPIVVAVNEARPSVVNIHGRKTVTESEGAHRVASKQVNGMGTGVVIDERGYIVTNYHVIEGVDRIQVTTAPFERENGDRIEGQTLTGRLIAHDPATDLAIIKIDTAAHLPVIRFGTSSDLMPGETVMAIGNAYGYEHTVTRGIISALHRPVQISDKQKYLDLIQTDASINPGNSGGPLLNIEGDMIGINVAVRVGAQGIGFAVPIDQAVDVVARLLNSEVVRKISHGIRGRTVPGEEERSTFVVSTVVENSAAATAGVEPGDIILDVEGATVERSLDFERHLLGRQAGDEVELTIQRGDSTRKVTLALNQAGRAHPEAITDRTWSSLGLRLAPISNHMFRELKSRFNGGLRVVAVRQNGPASKQGIRFGDILVGMHKWETISLDNVAYILESEEFRKTQPVRFYILRDGEMLVGQLAANAVGD